jgi:elongation factor G
VKLEPLMELAIEPTSAARERLATVLQAIGLQMLVDVRADLETGHFILGGWSEEQLSSALALLQANVPDEFNVGAPQVAYREYLAKPVDIDYTHKKQSGGTGQFGRVKVKVTPGERGTGFVFKDEIKGGNIPKEYIPAIEKGFRETAETGSLIGFPIIDFEVLLYDGAYHDVDSSALAFEIAARGAMREVAQKAGIKLLEPIMKVEVVTPEDYLGDVIGDMNSRSGQIQGTDSRGNAQVVEAMVPLANMFGYANKLNSFGQGRAYYTMQFSHYDEVPDGGGPPDTEPVTAALRA